MCLMALRNNEGESYRSEQAADIFESLILEIATFLLLPILRLLSRRY